MIAAQHTGSAASCEEAGVQLKCSISNKRHRGLSPLSVCMLGTLRKAANPPNQKAQPMMQSSAHALVQGGLEVF